MIGVISICHARDDWGDIDMSRKCVVGKRYILCIGIKHANDIYCSSELVCSVISFREVTVTNRDG